MRKSLASRTADRRVLTYGPQFKYKEILVVGSKVQTFFTSIALLLGAICFVLPPVSPHILSFLPFVRVLIVSGRLVGLLRVSCSICQTAPLKSKWSTMLLLETYTKFLLPSCRIKKNGFLEVTNVTTSVATSSKPPVNVRTVLRGQGDAGYYLTACTYYPYTTSTRLMCRFFLVMVTECALALLLSRHELPALGREGGVLTPTTAFGDVLVRRLEETGKFTIHSEVVLDSDESRKTR